LGESDSLRDDGEDEFDPLLDDEEEDKSLLKSKVERGQDLLYVGSLKVSDNIGSSKVKKL